MRRFADEHVAGLYPGYFALVMATGIDSIACVLEGMEGLARALLWFNIPAYALLWLLTIWRLVAYRERVAADLGDHGRAPGFFTTVAATSVLGTQIFMVQGGAGVPLALWVAGALLWAIITYGFFAIVTLKQDKPPIESGLNGAWLLAVVATQSVPVLGGLLAHHVEPSLRELVLFSCLCLYLVGCLLYVMLITLILHRFIFFRFTSVQLAPPYWINMGAVAITTVAGVNLLDAAPLSPLLGALAPALRGLTVFFWAIATWWVPLLIILGIWRHGVARQRIEYDPEYWGIVFPLGMYTTATARMAHVLELPFLHDVSRVTVVIALAAWGLTLFGLVRRLTRRAVRSAPRSP